VKNVNLNSLLGSLGGGNADSGSGAGAGAGFDVQGVMGLLSGLGDLKNLPEVQKCVEEACSKTNDRDQFKVVQDFIVQNKDNKALQGALTALLPKVLGLMKSMN